MPGRSAQLQGFRPLHSFSPARLSCAAGPWLALLLSLSLQAGCSHPRDDDPSLLRPEAAGELLLPCGRKGIYDPSLEYAPASGKLYMALSDIDDSQGWPERNDAVETRLFVSTDRGASWRDSGIELNKSTDLPVSSDDPGSARTWNHEVPALVRDPGAPPSERWKLFWHRYLWVNGKRAFQHGWIAMKTAPSPEGPWSRERKLFTGSLYAKADNEDSGAPEQPLNELYGELSSSLVFTEPGAAADENSLYLAMVSVDSAIFPSKTRIIILKLDHSSGSWKYLGSLFDNAADAEPYGFGSFGAPELFFDGGRLFILVVGKKGRSYQGTLLFEIRDIDKAEIKRRDGHAEKLLEIPASTSWWNGQQGAATYHPAAGACGILYSRVKYSEMHFRIFASHVIPGAGRSKRTLQSR